MGDLRFHHNLDSANCIPIMFASLFLRFSEGDSSRFGQIRLVVLVLARMLLGGAGCFHRALCTHTRGHIVFD